MKTPSSCIAIDLLEARRGIFAWWAMPWIVQVIFFSHSIVYAQKVDDASVRDVASLAIANKEPVTELPSVQMLLPGFSVRELPVALTNVNNVRYRADGFLYALGYNGDVWLLNDSDGDGLEETSKKFFENQGRLRGPIGMAVVPPDHALLAESVRDGKTRGQGLVVASKGKVSAILDLDGDDIAEVERVIASGWTEIPQNVDAIGVAIHPLDGAIYFGLGVKDYNKAYQLDSQGKSQFDLRTERGTIQRIEPDLSSRQTVCTGVRFTIGLGFDENHELFASDQEGATWLPNGNPFDELLHIQANRHYGFPPRHPNHLPAVFDEPSLFDYRPQHQSTCGLAFNLPLIPDGPIFGPSDWRGDVFVCGQSRGKLYRTRVLRNADGEYTATNQLIGCLSLLTVDCCLSPQGDLIVACHSGGPDWGSGPTGKGKLFQIRYRKPTHAQPIAIWPANPYEVRIEFDMPLAIDSLKQLVSHTEITYGEYVSAADRLESIRPGYAVTKLQQAAARFALPIYSASVTPNRETLILSTAEHRTAATYAIRLPGLGREISDSDSSVIPQLAAIDLAYSAHGVHAHWKSSNDRLPEWSGWLPHLDLELARAMTKGQRHVAALWERIESPGTLTLKTQFDPNGLFYPAVQPNSTLDYRLEDDRFITRSALHLTGTQTFDSGTEIDFLEPASLRDGEFFRPFELPLRSSSYLPIVVQMKTGDGIPSVQVHWHAELQAGVDRTGTVAVHRFVLPWIKPGLSEEPVVEERPSERLADAHWGRGRRVFMGTQAGCSKCHVAHGVGNKIGPDLSNLIHRDYDSVVRDIVHPSFSINPDFISYIVRLQDSRVLTGVLRSEGDQFWISDQASKETMFFRNEIDELKPSSMSIMPEGVIEKLDQGQRKDLFAFLLQEAPHMPRVGEGKPPRLRRREEVELALKPIVESGFSGETVGEPLKPLHVLLVAGKKDHGPGEHDYPAWLSMWSALMSASEAVTISTAMEWPSDEQFEAADTIVFFQKGQWNPQRAKLIDAHLAKGRGLVYIHWAIEGGRDAPLFAQRIGLASFAKDTHFRHGPLELHFPTGSNHPIARNFDSLDLVDESYWQLHGDPSKIETIGTVVEESQVRPLFWTVEANLGRVFVSIPGHYSWTFDDPLFRILLLRGIAWSARESVDRFNDLALLGVKLEN